jgi:hypothetical protein
MENEGNNQILKPEMVLSLQRILQRQQRRAVVYKDAQEIGESLVVFYELLADESGADEPVLKVELAGDNEQRV